MLLLKEDLRKRRFPGIMTQNVKLELVREVLAYDLDLGLKNVKGRDVFKIAEKIDSPMFNCMEMIAEKARLQGLIN